MLWLAFPSASELGSESASLLVFGSEFSLEFESGFQSGFLLVSGLASV